MKNPMGKGRSVEKPYAIFRIHDFEIRVLKTYQLPKNEKGLARWFTVARSPMTFGSWEYGDTYKAEVVDNFMLVEATSEFKEAYPELVLDMPDIVA